MAENGSERRRDFRFFDNREKYLRFVTTCSEQWAVAERIGAEFDRIAPTPPALKLFDAGMGDATVLTRVMRDMHWRFPTVPFLVVAKEISLEDIRLSLDKMADRFHEHPQTVLVMTNLYYSEAPWLQPHKPEAVAELNWWEVPLKGGTAHEFDAQIKDLQSMIGQGWQTKASASTGNPLYVAPSVLVLYRADRRFALDRVIPKRGEIDADYDLIIASQPYRSRLPAEIKIRNVLGPLTRALGPGGRMVVIQSTGRDPGMDIIHRIWPDEAPFRTPAAMLIEALGAELSAEIPGLAFEGPEGGGSHFKYHLHALPNEIGNRIGTSTLLAAWNAAVYVAQIDDQQLTDALDHGNYLEATREVLRQHGGLWFLDESFVVGRKAP